MSQLEEISDDDLIDEVLRRDLREDLRDCFMEEIDLDDFSDSEITREYNDRGLCDDDLPDIRDDMSDLYELMHQGRPYEEKLREIIYAHTGRIL